MTLTETQLNLFLKEVTIEDQFWAFHEANPHIEAKLYDRAMLLKSLGYTQFSMKGLFELLRFDPSIETESDDYKVNNNYTAYYSRLLMEKYPDDLDGFFVTRILRAKPRYTPRDFD